MIRLHFISILFSIHIAKSNAQFGVNLQTKMVHISSKTWDSYKEAKTQDDLVRKLRASNETNSIKERSHYIEKILNHLMMEMPSTMNLHNSLRTLYRTITQIDTIYVNFLGLIAPGKGFSQSNVNSFLMDITKGRIHNIEKLMKTLYNVIVGGPYARRGTFTTLREIFKTDLGVCNLKQSPQGTVFSIYEIIMLAEMKAYIIRQFAAAYYSDESMSELHTQYLERVNEIGSIVKPYLSSASRHLWKCDPTDEHEEDVTFSRFVNTFTYMMIKKNEIGGGVKDICLKNCVDLGGTHHNCSGEIKSCYFYGTYAKICHADERSGRRLTYVQNIETRAIYGKNEDCKPRHLEFIHSYQVTPAHVCSWCFCACEYTKDSHRYISLIPVTSIILVNKVITGIRFQKVNKVLYLQIQEGLLIGEGLIRPQSLHWRDIEFVKVHETEYVYSSRMYTSKEYYSLNWNGRFLDLDELYVPAKHVLTGVGMIFYRNGHMGFTIRATKFRFLDGVLYPETSRWIQTEMNPERKHTYSDPDPEIPTLSKIQSTPVLDKDIYIPLRPSSIVKDIGQEVVPYIDLTPVKAFPPVPLVGLALILKKQEGYGGFLSWRAVTYDYFGHVFPEDEL